MEKLLGTLKPYLDLIGRVMLAWLFIYSGWTKMTGEYDKTAAFMDASGISGKLLPLVLLLQLGGGIAIIVGFLTRPISVFMIAFLVVASFMFHGAAGQELSFWMNISIAGGFLVLIANGAGLFSIDELIRRKLGWGKKNAASAKQELANA